MFWEKNESGGIWFIEMDLSMNLSSLWEVGKLCKAYPSLQRTKLVKVY